MKNKMFTFLLAVMASVSMSFAEIYSGSCGVNLTWSLNTEDSVLNISGTGLMEAFNNTSDNPWYVHRTAIKSAIIGSGVTSIGKAAFYDCTSLTSVTIPNSVTYIGVDAFSKCSGLTSVTIPNNVTSIENGAFEWCSSLTSMNIPDGVTKIGRDAFRYCNGLTSVSIPVSITQIAAYAFEGCNGLTRVNITDLTAWCNITFNGSGSNPLSNAKHLYLNDTEITNLVIPESITEIGSSTFYNCSGITSVTIHNSVTHIGEGAFSCCTGLTSLVIPNSVTRISGSAFSGCSGLTSIEIPNSVTTIGSYAFSNCYGLTSVTIPNSITRITEGAFFYCRNLISVTIPSSVTRIDESAFSKCYGLTKVNITDLAAWCNITFSALEDNPLNDARHLYLNDVEITDLVIPESVTSISNYVFYRCESLTSLTIPNSVTSIGSSAFHWCTGITSITCKAVIPPTSSPSAFQWIDKFTPLYVPAESVEAYKAADVWKEFTNILPIGSESMPYIIASGTCGAEDDNLKWTLTSDSVLTISGTGAMADYESYTATLWYSNRESIKSIVIKEGVTSIGKHAFCSLNNLTSVTIPNSITVIGNYAFGSNVINGCSGLTAVNIYDLAAWCNISFSAASSNPLYYAKNLYLNGTLVKDLVIPNGITKINDYAFYNCSSLTSATIPNSVTSIGKNAFYGSKSLASITIPNSIDTIGSVAFVGCSSLNAVNISDLAAWCNISFSAASSNPLNYAKNLYLNGILVEKIVIPNGVTKINDYTFYNCSSLTSVTIPNGVTSIGNSAFYGCSSMTAVTIPSSVTTIGSSAFGGCSSLTAVNIYDLAAWCNISFSAASSNPLYYAKNLYLNGTLVEELVIPDGITKINDYAFYNCSSLTSVTIPNSVTSIGKNAFYKCSGLTSVTIPNSVDSIGTNAFRDCTGITSLTISNSVTTIESAAFWGCTGLTSITNLATIPQAVSTYVFGNPSSNTAVDYSVCILYVPAESVEAYKAADVWKEFTNILPIGESSDSCVIASGTCGAEGDNLTWTLTCDSVLTISGTGAMAEWISSSSSVPWYSNKSTIRSVIIEDGVTSIVDWAFENCTNLISVTIPNSFKSIGVRIFSGCTALTSVTIPNSVTSIEKYAFYGCSALTSIEIPNSVTSMAEGAFASCLSLTSIEIPNSVTSIAYSAFEYCTALTSIAIPNSVTNIGDWAFYGCSSLTTIEIPNSVTSIGRDAFLNCNSLTSIEIPNSVTSIGNETFSGCSGLTSVMIPNSVTSIGDHAFYWCIGLPSITIPNSVTSIGNEAFSGCTGLTSITNLATTPQAVTSYVFGNLASNTAVDYSACTLYVPAESIEAYKAADVWKEFTNILPIGESSDSCVIASGTCGAEGDNLTWTLTCDSVLTISGMGAIKKFNSTSRAPWYEYRESIKFAVIEEGVTSIGNLAFRDCSVLKSVTIPNSVISIGYDAFGYCSNLTSVIIPNSITSIGSYAFSRSGLTSVTLSNNLTTIETDVFMDCSNLTSVIIPNSITSIRGSAFQGCSGMTSVTFGNGITSIGDLAFCDCNALTNITIPNSVTSIGVAPFSGCDNLTSINVTSDNTNYCSIDGVLFSKDKTALIQYPCGKQGTYTIPNSVISIGEMAFAYCPTLSSITIPSNVTSIDQWAFDSNSLNSITNYATNPQAIHTNVFSHVDKSTCTLYVPAQCLAAYQAADVWKDFGNILPIDGSEVLSIAEAVQIGMALDSMATSAETYTIEGYVINAGTFYAGAKYQNWYMADDQETASSDFQAYKCYPIDGIDTVEVRNGSKVRMTGHLQKYYDRQKALYVVEMTYTPAIILSKPQIDTITVAEALALGAELEDNASTSKQYAIRGYVSSFSPYYEQLGDQNFYIADDPNSTANTNAAGGFYVYRGIPSTGSAVNKGDLVELTCAIRKYVPASGTNIKIENSEFPVAVTVLQTASDTCIIASGTCGAEGDNLTWTLTCDNVLTISGTGAMADFEWSNAEGNPIIPWKSYREMIKYISLPEGLTSIGNYAFYGCTSLTSVAIPNSVTSIGWGAFYDCRSLTSIDIPNSVTTIESRAFENCIGMTSLSLSNAITFIGEYAFVGCTNLLTVTIPNSLTYMGAAAFGSCKRLTSIDVEADNQAFCSEDGVLFSKDKTIIRQYPAGKEDESYSIPNTVKIIYNRSFTKCSHLKDLTIPNSVLSIGQCAFGSCSGLSTITIPNSVTSIESYAFSSCSGLTSVEIPASVTNIKWDAFQYCSRLSSITNYSPTPQTIEADVFNTINLSACTLYVPAESLEFYQTADVWKEFGTILPIEGTGTPIETVEGNYTIYYTDKDSRDLTDETVTLHVPVAPVIEGFTFLKWVIVAGDLEDGIAIQAVYEADMQTGTPEVYTNPANHAQKLLRNGHVYILTDDRTYTIQGQRTK